MTVPNPPAPGAHAAPAGRARLVTRATAPEAFTALQECDARLALCRGLAEYLEGITFDAQGGRKVRFKAVHEEYAEPEENIAYPSARIGLRGASKYEARSFTPSMDPKCRLPLPDGRYMVVPCDIVTELGVEMYANDPLERSALVMALEQAFVPNAYKYGFDLELPYYFNVRANYAMQELNVEDSADDSMRRVRTASFVLTARVPLVQLYSFPDARPLFDLRAVGAGPDVLFTLAVS